MVVAIPIEYVMKARGKPQPKIIHYVYLWKVKVRNKYCKRIKILLAVKNILCCTLLWVLLSSFHPYYISVTDVKYNEQEKTLQISCRTFTDNIEDALEKIYKKQLDVLHPKDKKEMDELLADYLAKHVKIKVNGKQLLL